MKWFRHLTDSYTNLKHREIMEEFGLEGYGFFWLCCELIGQQGVKYRLKNPKSWLKALKNTSNLSEEKINKFLKKFAELNLISSNALKNNELYIPKMREYSDDYTKFLRRRSEETSSRIDKIRIDKIIREYIDLKNWDTSNKELIKEVYKRNVRPAKQLALIAKDNDTKALREISAYLIKKGLSWTLETIIKHYPEWPFCPKCDNTGRYENERGYKVTCDCPAGVKRSGEK